MNPASHLLISWVTANTADISRRDRLLVTISGVVPDLDGAGVIAEIITQNTTTPLLWWSKYHHVLCHNIGFGLLIAGLVFLLSIKRWMTTFLALLAFHLHLLGDLIGSRGPEGYQWPIPYLFPFADIWNLTWKGQWELNAWPNILITLMFISMTLYLAWKRGFSPLELISRKIDSNFVDALRRRFGEPK
jgi:hypothetical protein